MDVSCTERCAAYHRKKRRKIQSSKTRFKKENSYAMELGIFQIIVYLYLV
jgi:hypothetical protein